MDHDRVVELILITGNFKKYDRYGIATGETEFVVSHGVDPITGRDVVVPCDHPRMLGGVYDSTYGEWVIYASKK